MYYVVGGRSGSDTVLKSDLKMVLANIELKYRVQYTFGIGIRNAKNMYTED